MYTKCFSDKTIFNHNRLILFGFNSILIIFSRTTIYIYIYIIKHDIFLHSFLPVLSGQR